MRIRATALGRPCGRMIRVDDVVCLLTPEPFHAVGEHYDDFAQTSGQEVIALHGARLNPVRAHSSGTAS
jgi:predicted phosphoribosyltransferase